MYVLKVSMLTLKNSKIRRQLEKIIIHKYQTNHSIFVNNLVIYKAVNKTKLIIE